MSPLIITRVFNVYYCVGRRSVSACMHHPCPGGSVISVFKKLKNDFHSEVQSIGRRQKMRVLSIFNRLSFSSFIIGRKDSSTDLKSFTLKNKLSLPGDTSTNATSDMFSTFITCSLSGIVAVAVNAMIFVSFGSKLLISSSLEKSGLYSSPLHHV